MRSHIQVPTPVFVDGVLRLYFASRPKPTLSLTGYVDLDPEDPTRVLHVHPDPILDLGAPGTFDEFGIMPSSIVEHDGALFMYYSGWSRMTTVPYHNATGLAVSEDNGRSFRKLGDGPILDRTLLEPYSATSPFVMRLARDDWRIFYSSGIGWSAVGEKYEHVYDIKTGYSQDGIWWTRKGESAISQQHPLEALTRPAIVRHGGMYHMYFCHRHSRDFRDGEGGYRLGYAHSTDLRNWVREMNRSPLECGPEGAPDSHMAAYPALALDGDKTYLFYNGNGFGEKGLLLATPRVPLPAEGD